MAPTLITDCIGAWAKKYRATEPAYYASADSEDVMVYTKESGDARYVIAINNRWKERPDIKLCDIGVAQKTMLKMRETRPGAAVYDVLEGRRVETTAEPDGTLRIPCELGPGAGRIYAVYPAAISEIQIPTDQPVVRGTLGTLEIRVLDAGEKTVAGRQGLQVEVKTPDGKIQDASGTYSADDGKAIIHLRPSLDDQKGPWKIVCQEIASGEKAEVAVTVE